MNHLCTSIIAGLFMTTPVLAQSDAAPATPPATSAPADAPEAKTLFEKSLEAMGGAQAWKDVKTMHTKMTIPVMNQAVDYYKGEDGKMYAEQSMGTQVIRLGSNGEATWVEIPGTGYQLLDGMMKKQALGQLQMADPMTFVEMSDELTQMTTAGEDNFMDEAAWRVHAVSTDGEENDLYFSKKSGRLLGITAQSTNPLGQPVEMKMEFKEWKAFGDLSMFTVMQMSSAGQSIEMKFEEVEFNNVPDSKFELPEEVKQMVDDTPAGQPATQPGG